MKPQDLDELAGEVRDLVDDAEVSVFGPADELGARYDRRGVLPVRDGYDGVSLAMQHNGGAVVMAGSNGRWTSVHPEAVGVPVAPWRCLVVVTKKAAAIASSSTRARSASAHS